MNHLTADNSLRELFRGIAEPVEIRDSDGNVMGYYTPLTTPEQKATYERLIKLFDLEEAARTLATERDQGRPLAEVMRHLRSLEGSG